MELMKKQLEEMGVLKKSEVQIKTYKCLAGNCNSEYRTERGYDNHLKRAHSTIYVVSPQVPKIVVTRDAAATTNSTPSNSKKSVNMGILADKTNYSNTWVTVTAWSMVRLGYADTFCEEIKKIMEMQQKFYNNAEHQPNHNEPFTYVTQKPFRKSILSMANNIKLQLLERIKESKFYSLHIGETVDIQPFSHLLVIIRYIHKQKRTIAEDILFSQALNPQWTQNELFAIINTVIGNNGLDWKKCVGISMDGGRATTGPLRNFVEHIRKNNLFIRITYTLSRRGEFIKANLSHELKLVLIDVIKLVNEFKTRDGVKLTENIDLKFKNLFNYTDDYWLSYGHVLQTMFHIAQHSKVSTLHNIVKLAFLVDIIKHFDQLNVELIKREATIFDIYDQISALFDKLGTYKDEIRNNNFNAFPNLLEIFKRNEYFPDDAKYEIKSSIKMLRKNLVDYLPVPKHERADYEWIRKPFDINECPAMFTKRDEMREWKLFKKEHPKFIRNNIETFWISMHLKYPRLSDRALKLLLIFRSSRFYETGFAALVDMRIKHATDSNSEDSYLRVKLSPIKPDV